MYVYVFFFIIIIIEVEMKPFNLYQSMKTDVLVNEDSCLNMSNNKYNVMFLNFK